MRVVVCHEKHRNFTHHTFSHGYDEPVNIKQVAPSETITRFGADGNS